jgi:hypothetical protein
MAVSVAGGLAFGTLLILFILPSAIYMISDLRVLFHKKKSRNELEPAYQKAE